MATNEVKIILTEEDQASPVHTAAVGKMEQATDSFSSKFSGIASMVKSNWLGITAAVGVAVGVYKTIEAATDETRKLGSETSKLQRLTGETAESASAMIAVAHRYGVEFETLQGAVVAVSRRMGGLKDIETEVADATGKATDVFEKFGIEVKNSDGSVKKFGDVFDQIRGRIREAGNQTEQLAIATQFFRGNAAQLMPLLTMTDEKYRELADHAKKLGLVLSQDNVDAIKKYSFAQKDLNEAWSGVKIQLGTMVMPVLKEFMLMLSDTTTRAVEFAAAIKGGIISALDALGLSSSDTAKKVEETAQAEKTAAQSAEEQASQIARTIKVLAEYAALIEKVGEERLKMAASDFSEKLKLEETRIDKTKAALTSYLNEIHAVYAARYSGEVKILELMKQTNDSSKIAQQQAIVLQVEMQGAQARLTGWNQYFNNLEQRYNQNVQALLATQSQIESYYKLIYDNTWSYYDLQDKLRQTDMTASQKYYDQQQVLETRFQAALMLDGEARVRALMAYQQAAMATVGAVTEGDNTVITSSQTVATARGLIDKAQLVIADTTEKMIAKLEAQKDMQMKSAMELAAEMDKTRLSIEAVKKEIMALYDQIDRQRILSIETKGALEGIKEVQRFLDKIPPITYKQVVIEYFTKASPIMPFTEGMSKIQAMMTSLPKEGEFTMKFGQLAADWEYNAKSAETMQAYHRGGVPMTLEAIMQGQKQEGQANFLWSQMMNMFNASQKQGAAGGINVSIPIESMTVGNEASGTQAAADIQTKLAQDIRDNRSPIIPALLSRLRQEGMLPA